MESNEGKQPGPVIERRGNRGKWWLEWQGKVSGPWGFLEKKPVYSPDGKHWAVRGELHQKWYVLIDGIKHGPFDSWLKQPWFDRERSAFVFTAGRKNEFYLMIDGRIIKTGRIFEKGEGKVSLHIEGRRYGPYEDIREGVFSPSGGKWAAAAWRGDQCWLLLNGKEHGPFRKVGDVEFGPGIEPCACRVDRGNGPELLIDGERFYGPYDGIFGPEFSPDGRRWGMDIAMKNLQHGFIVDGETFGPFPYQYFFPRFSADSRRWFVVLDGGREDRPYAFILNGRRCGPFRIREIGFMADGRFLSTYYRRKRYFINFDGREIGPFEHKEGDGARSAEGVSAVMGWVGRGRKRRRCLISCRLREEEKHIFFSANGGDSVEDAIMIINAGGTDDGVAAEHLYMRLVMRSQGLAGEFMEQRLFQENGRSYDQLLFGTAEGEMTAKTFDISEFYGKLA